MKSPKALLNYRIATSRDGCGYHQIGEPSLFVLTKEGLELRGAIPFYQMRWQIVVPWSKDPKTPYLESYYRSILDRTIHDELLVLHNGIGKGGFYS